MWNCKIIDPYTVLGAMNTYKKDMHYASIAQVNFLLLIS